MSKLIMLFDRTIGRRLYKLHRVLYRATGGIIGHRSPAGRMLLLTTVGRRTGQSRTTPLLYMPDGPEYVVVGSNGGRDEPPAWVLNLAATPEVRIQVGHRRMEATARILSDGERDAIWQRLRQYYRGWSEYQENTERRLKVVVLVPNN